MSTITTTVKAPSDAQVARKVTTLSKRLGATFTERKGIHVTRAELVVELRNLGLSYAAMEKHVTVTYGHRVPGATGSTFGRYGQVADVLARDDVNAIVGTSDAREALVNALYRLSGPTPKSGVFAGTSPAERLTRAGDEIARVKGSAHAVEILEAMVKGFNSGEVADATTAPKREVAGEAADGGKVTADTGEAEEIDADEVTTGETTASLASTGTSALIAELTRRYSGSRATVHSDDADALTALLSRVESLVTGGRVVTRKR